MKRFSVKRMEVWSKSVIVPLLAAILVVLPVQSAYAELVSTSSVLAGQSAPSGRSRLQTTLARTDVQRTLTAFGVDAEEARERVAALTDAEISALDGRIDSLPAGGGVLTAVAVTFIILIILDVIGITDIFTFIHPVN